MSWIGTIEWTIRKSCWNFVAALKYRRNHPKSVDRVEPTSSPLQLVPLAAVYPEIPITDVLIADHPPPDEIRAEGRFLARVLAWFAPTIFPAELFLRGLTRLYTTRFSPMQAGRPDIPLDPSAAVAQAYTTRHRCTVQKRAAALHLDPKRTLEVPRMPIELDTSPDLGALAVRGPYASYLQKVNGTENQYEWNLRELRAYETHFDLHEPWAHVLFEFHEDQGALRPCRIECELGIIVPSDPAWWLAIRIAVCAATTHTALVRHWTWTHLIGGELLSYATRTQLPQFHPVTHLLWPHMVGTHSSNRLAMLGQLPPGGDFETIYSFTYNSLCLLISKSAATFDLNLCDPEGDSQRRGIRSPLPTPTLDNCCRLFSILQAHAERYLRLYYTDATLQQDEPIQQWIHELDRRLPNGLGLSRVTLDCRSLATVIAKFMYLGSVHHEHMGTLLWNYQAWPQTHPVRVYRTGRRLPEDVYQRLINSNYILNVIRTPLMTDLTALALEGERASEATRLFQTFTEELADLQRMMARESWAAWKIYPFHMEANINA